MNTIRRLAASVHDDRSDHQGGGLYCPASCTLDVDEKYRFTLERRWAKLGVADFSRLGLFVMLNPSTADALKDDATIRRLTGYCKDWSLSGFDVLNLFALRATNPKKLVDTYVYNGFTRKTDDQPVNDRFLKEAASRPYAFRAFAWGAGMPKGSNRDLAVDEIFRYAGCSAFGHTKAGFPLHPLRLPKTAKLYPYVTREIP